MSPQLTSALRAAERRLGLWWVVSFAAIFVLPAIAWASLEAGLVDPTGGDPGWLRPTAHVAAVGLAAISVLIRCWLLSDRRLYEFLQRPPHPTSPAADAVSSYDRKLLELATWITPAFLVGWTVNTGIVLLGVLLSMVSADVADMTSFVFVAAVLELLSIPRLEPYVLRASGLAGA